MPYICPVCGYDQLHEPPYTDGKRPAYDADSHWGKPTFEVCPSCGVEFGDDDFERSWTDLRQHWASRGHLWWSSSRPRPGAWNPMKQLHNLKRLDSGKQHEAPRRHPVKRVADWWARLWSRLMDLLFRPG